jgi:ABC-type sugar transport system permease subunit
MIHTWNQIMDQGRYGYGTALLWMLFIGILILTWIVFWSQKYWVYTGAADEGGN